MPTGPKETHESYGMLSFSRVSGGESILFGSSIPHQETIQLSIGPAEIERSLNTDWYYGNGGKHIVVEMSHSQFSEAITSMNMGSGVPVTIKRLNGKRMADPQFTNKRIQFEKEFQTKMEQLEHSLRALTKETEDILTNKKAVTKTDRSVILNQLRALKTEIAMNIPFMASMYNEQLDKTTQEAKGEIEAFTLNKLNQLGIQKLEELKNERLLDTQKSTDLKELDHHDPIKQPDAD